MKKSLSFSLAGLSILVSATAARASDYPPGYVIQSSCQQKGAVEVCAYNQNYGGYPRISVRYSGNFLGQERSAWVQFNGRSGLFPLGSDGSLFLNQPIAYKCWDGGVPAGFEGPYRPCRESTAATPTGYLIWEIEPIPQAEKDLFFYARNEHGIANAWDIEIAIVDENGNWDSLYGENYNFRF